MSIPNNNENLDPKTLDLSDNQPKKKESQWKLLPPEEQPQDVFDANRARRLKKLGLTDKQPMPLPRPDLREGPFRKYEPFILAALEGSCKANPFPTQTATTFACRFKDAILGFKRYKYLSKIPEDADLDCIKVQPLDNGQVWLLNTKKDMELKERRLAREAAQAAQAASGQPIPPTSVPQVLVAPTPAAVKPVSLADTGLPEVSDRSAWRAFIEAQIEKAWTDYNEPITFYYKTPEDRDFIIELHKLNEYDLAVAFRSAEYKVDVYSYLDKDLVENLPSEDVFHSKG